MNKNWQDTDVDERRGEKQVVSCLSFDESAYVSLATQLARTSLFKVLRTYRNKPHRFMLHEIYELITCVGYFIVMNFPVVRCNYSLFSITFLELMKIKYDVFTLTRVSILNSHSEMQLI